MESNRNNSGNTSSIDHNKFHKYITSLLKISKLVFDSLDEYNLLGDAKRAESIKDINKALNLYQRCYNNSEINERVIYINHFKKIYQEYKPQILGGLTSIDWLSRGQIKAIFMDRMVGGERYYIALHLSNIFQLAYLLREKAEDKIKSMKLSQEEYDNEYDKCDAIFYLDHILHDIYSIFHCISDHTEDRMILNAVVSQLEETVGLGENEDAGEGFTGVAKSALKLLNKSKLLPEGVDINNNQVEGIVNTIGGIFDNVGAKGIFGKMMDDIKDARDIKDVVLGITKNFDNDAINSLVREKIDELNINDNLPKPPTQDSKSNEPGTTSSQSANTQSNGKQEEETIEIVSGSTVDIIEE